MGTCMMFNEGSIPIVREKKIHAVSVPRVALPVMKANAMCMVLEVH